MMSAISQEACQYVAVFIPIAVLGAAFDSILGSHLHWIVDCASRDGTSFEHVSIGWSSCHHANVPNIGIGAWRDDHRKCGILWVSCLHRIPYSDSVFRTVVHKYGQTGYIIVLWNEKI